MNNRDQTYFNFKGYYTLTIDGKLIRSLQLSYPNKTFNDVKVFAGDDYYEPSDASFKNLFWKNLPVPDILFHVDTPSIVSRDNTNS